MIHFFLKFFKKKQSIKSGSSLPFLFLQGYWGFVRKVIDRFLFFIKKHGKLFFSLIIAFLISDLLLIRSYDFLIPDKELPPLKLSYGRTSQVRSLDLYKSLWEDNIFHTGPIPLKLKELEEIHIEPVLSSLPFKLKGTIIHANPLRSVASILAGGKTDSYKQGGAIENQAEIKEIQRGKVVFFNQNNNRLEYIALPEKQNPSLNISYANNKPSAALVQRAGLNRFQVKRSDLEEYLQKLPEILNQARVIPHRSKDGEIIGWKFSSIDKGSVFEELGFTKGDILKEVDGKVVQSTEQALELFDKLRGESRLKIVVEKDGKDENYEYNVSENAPMR